MQSQPDRRKRRNTSYCKEKSRPGRRTLLRMTSRAKMLQKNKSNFMPRQHRTPPAPELKSPATNSNIQFMLTREWRVHHVENPHRMLEPHTYQQNSTRASGSCSAQPCTRVENFSIFSLGNQVYQLTTCVCGSRPPWHEKTVDINVMQWSAYACDSDRRTCVAAINLS